MLTWDVSLYCISRITHDYNSCHSLGKVIGETESHSVNRIFQYNWFQGINIRSHYCSIMVGSHNENHILKVQTKENGGPSKYQVNATSQWCKYLFLCSNYLRQFYLSGLFYFHEKGIIRHIFMIQLNVTITDICKYIWHYHNILPIDVVHQYCDTFEKR